MKLAAAVLMTLEVAIASDDLATLQAEADQCMEGFNEAIFDTMAQALTIDRAVRAFHLGESPEVLATSLDADDVVARHLLRAQIDMYRQTGPADPDQQFELEDHYAWRSQWLEPALALNADHRYALFEAAALCQEAARLRQVGISLSFCDTDYAGRLVALEPDNALGWLLSPDLNEREPDNVPEVLEQIAQSRYLEVPRRDALAIMIDKVSSVTGSAELARSLAMMYETQNSHWIPMGWNALQQFCAPRLEGFVENRVGPCAGALSVLMEHADNEAEFTQVQRIAQNLTSQWPGLFSVERIAELEQRIGVFSTSEIWHKLAICYDPGETFSLMTSQEWFDQYAEQSGVSHAQWVMAALRPIVEAGRERRGDLFQSKRSLTAPTDRADDTEIASAVSDSQSPSAVVSSEPAATGEPAPRYLPWILIAVAIGVILGPFSLLRLAQRRATRRP